MKPASLNEIKNTLKSMGEEQLREQLLRIVKFRKENKELLSFILFMEEDIPQFILDTKLELDLGFDGLKTGTTYTRTKALRKILKTINKYIKFSGNKMAEVELVIYFCLKMKKATVNHKTSTTLFNLYQRQVDRANKSVLLLHEDKQGDYKKDLEAIII